MIERRRMESMYVDKKKSMSEMAKVLGVSNSTIVYWMSKYEIPRRSRSDATYAKRNPTGDPFRIRNPRTVDDAELMGLGLGLYWGEGTKASRTQVRLGNTDPALVLMFVKFLTVICGVPRDRIRYGLQVFSDMDPRIAKQFWMKKLNVSSEQFLRKIVVTPTRSLGTYRNKSKYGVLTVYMNNVKLRNRLIELLGERGMEY